MKDLTAGSTSAVHISLCVFKKNDQFLITFQLQMQSVVEIT